VKLQTRDIFATMQDDLDRVDERVARAGAVDFPIVSELVADIVRAGGKRLRPIILLLAGRAFDANLDRLVTAAAGVELLHIASLIHDDSIDRSALRRGKPTLNSKLNSGAVILVGDYLFARSAMLAAATNMNRVVSIFASTLGDICDGQLREMFDAHRLDQTQADYERRIFGKTASLFAGSAEMGATIGEADEAATAALRHFGENFGIAFQIMDDVLDLRESTSDLGKPSGNDLRQGTVTLPVMRFAAKLPPDSSDAQLLQHIVSGDQDDDADIDRLVDKIRLSGAIEESVAEAERFVQIAKASLVHIPDGDARTLLSDLADSAIDRTA
jgi:geranylgeranyl pyrophosphate synthase